VTATRGPLVVKLGGTAIAEERGVLREVAAMARDRAVVVVHGGGKRLSEWLDRLGVEHRFHEGLRVTDDAALDVALAVLRGLVNGELVAALRSLGGRAVGLSGIDGGLLSGDRQPGLGRVITAPRADTGVLDVLVAAGHIPVVAPLGTDADGLICNVNADDAAAAIAGGLGATLVLLTDTDGVRGMDGSRIATLTGAEAETLIEQGVVAGGMVPKVRAAARALSEPGTVAIIADGRVPEALARALGEERAGTHIGS
jgi:acetylglutamate kinase